MKRINKKAIFGMLVAMILSLGIMGGINGQNHDFNVQQIAVVTSYAAPNESGAAKAVLNVTSGSASAVASGCYAVALTSGSTGVGIPIAVAFGIWGVACTL
jgi:hypothetical protein